MEKEAARQLGPTGETVRANVARIRKGSGLSLRDLHARTQALGRPISVSALSKVETGYRRVDVDDLMTLAQALNASPVALLLPATGPADEVATSAGHATTALLWEWVLGEQPLDGPSRAFKANSLPDWLETGGVGIDWPAGMSTVALRYGVDPSKMSARDERQVR